MATLIIREVPEEIVAALDERARSNGASRESWLREQLRVLARSTVMPERYALQFVRSQPPRASGMIIQRGGSIQGSYVVGENGFIPDSAFNAYFESVHIAEVNEPGARERAIARLATGFDDVREVPMPVPVEPPKGETMELRQALQIDDLVAGAMNRSEGEPVVVFRETDLPAGRTQYRLVIHQPVLPPINLHYATLDELEVDLAHRRQHLKADEWERLQ